MKSKLQDLLDFHGAGSAYSTLKQFGLTTVKKFSEEPLENIKGILMDSFCSGETIANVTNAYFEARGHFKPRKEKPKSNA